MFGSGCARQKESLALNAAVQPGWVDVYLRNVDDQGREVVVEKGLTYGYPDAELEFVFFEKGGQKIVKRPQAGQNSSLSVSPRSPQRNIEVNDLDGYSFQEWYLQDLYGLPNSCYNFYVKAFGSYRVATDHRTTTLVSNTAKICFHSRIKPT